MPSALLTNSILTLASRSPALILCHINSPQFTTIFSKHARIRFLLADDAGAGKTIMAGLLIRELKLRGLAERILIVCPANLAFQWQRELKEKFDEKFLVIKGGDIRDQFGMNQWMEQKQIITSLDLAKREDILPACNRWAGI